LEPEYLGHVYCVLAEAEKVSPQILVVGCKKELKYVGAGGPRIRCDCCGPRIRCDCCRRGFTSGDILFVSLRNLEREMYPETDEMASVQK
jgi:hypothetical protein